MVPRKRCLHDRFLPPKVLRMGDGATPAVHNTVALIILFRSAITPCSSSVSTLTPVTTFTPSRAASLAAIEKNLALLADDDLRHVAAPALALGIAHNKGDFMCGGHFCSRFISRECSSMLWV
jgi:hypothetical protein